ncbi:osmolarity two-component system protein sln1 [Stemphylium lycopersici]|nr:osmolarity two-component system protein sln1 [Stemphylium lycopersici]
MTTTLLSDILAVDAAHDEEPPGYHEATMAATAPAYDSGAYDEPLMTYRLRQYDRKIQMLAAYEAPGASSYRITTNNSFRIFSKKPELEVLHTSPAMRQRNMASISFDNDGGFPWRPRAHFDYTADDGLSSRYHMESMNFEDWTVGIGDKKYVWTLAMRPIALILCEQNSDAVIARFTFSDKGVLALRGAEVGQVLDRDESSKSADQYGKVETGPAHDDRPSPPAKSPQTDVCWWRANNSRPGASRTKHVWRCTWRAPAVAEQRPRCIRSAACCQKAAPALLQGLSRQLWQAQAAIRSCCLWPSSPARAFTLHHALPCASRSPDPIQILCRSPTTPPKNSAHFHPGAWDTDDSSYLPPSPAIVPLTLLLTLACQLPPAKHTRRDACPSRHGQDAHPHSRAIGLSGAAGLDDRPGRHSSCDMGTYCRQTTILSVADIDSSPTTALCWTYGMAISSLTQPSAHSHADDCTRSTRLTLTASLKAAQLSSNLALMQILVQQAASRLSPQAALDRYYGGNNTDDNWTRVGEDFDAIFSGDMRTRVAIQAKIYPYNSSEKVLFSRTALSMMDVVLPIQRPDGQNATLGDPEYGFIPELYPNFSVETIEYNATMNMYKAHYQGRTIDNTSYLFIGPYRVNETLSLVSVTAPIINNTSNIDTLGWLTTVLDASLITNVVNAIEGLDQSGLTLLFGPSNVTNVFPSEYLYSTANPTPPEDVQVRFLAPPTQRDDVQRHEQYGAALDPPPFDWTQYPAIRKGFTKPTGATNNAGSIISTDNEDGDDVAVGYAIVNSPMVNWMIIIEQTHNEVWRPIYHLRNVIIACVFGTIGALLLLAFPVAHFSSQPIRRLRDATKKTVSPHMFDDDDFSLHNDGVNEDMDEAALAHKEGFFGQIIHYRRNAKLNRAERKEAERRRQFRIPTKVKDRKHFIHDELTDLTTTFNEMTDELMMQYEKLEERVAQRTAELEQSKKAAEAANESKTLFIANISHELKTPLNGILGMCAVCMSEDDPIKLRRSLGIIYKSGDLLLNLLTDLLTFSKNQVGQALSLDEKEFRLRDISSQVLAIFEKQAREGGIQLAVEFEGPYENNLDSTGRPNELRDLGPFGLGRLKDMVLYGDQHRILQVVINLVSNSLKFTPPGGSVTLTIRCPGEAHMSDSRKASLQSRQSSMRNSKTRIRASASEVGSVSVATPSHYDTANVINPMDKGNAYSHYMAQERAATPPPGRWLSFEFEVEDTGPGIPDHLHAKIFEPFVQGDLGLSKKFGGTGLGLSICSQLAGLMKGTVGLKSEVGHGSVFTMVIPLKHLTSRADSTASSRNVNLETGTPRRSLSIDDPPRGRSHDDALSGRSIHSGTHSPISTGNTAATAPAGPVAFETDTKPRLVGLSQPFFASNAPLESPNSQVAAMKRVEAEATKRGDKVKVLVAEDNKTNQEVVLRMLKLEDVYDVTVAKDGQEALDKVKESMERQAPYNLIFMDVQMPNLDGLQSTRLIRQSGFLAPIVALTAYAEESNVKECLDSGMDFFLSKPIRRPALKHVLKTYCQTIPEEEAETTPPNTAAAAPIPNGTTKSVAATAATAATAPFTVFASTSDRPAASESPAVSPMTSPAA